MRMSSEKCVVSLAKKVSKKISDGFITALDLQRVH